MNNSNVIEKKYFFISLFIHLILIIFVYFALRDNQIRKEFIVYGVYSKKPSQAFFKSSKLHSNGNFSSMGNGHCKKSSGRHKIRIRKKSSNIKSKIHEQNSVKKESKTDKINKKNIKHKSKKESIKAKQIELKQLENQLEEEKKVKKLIDSEIKKIKKTEKKKIIRRVEPEVKKEIEPKPEEINIEEEKVTDEIIEEELKKEEAITDNQDLDTLNNNPENIDSENLTENEEELNFNLGESSENLDSKLAIYQKHIKKEVERLWKPPIGISKGTECTLSFVADNDGCVKDFQIIKRSNILIYDLSVLRIARSFHFDKCLWGKKFKITFRQ